MKIDKLNASPSIPSSAPVRFKEMGNIFEIMCSEKRSKGGYITKIDKDHFVDNRTGELHEFKHIENRAQDLQNVAKSLSRGRDLLNTNITDVSYCRWLTLTYAENMTNPQKLHDDFKNFNKRLRAEIGHYEYITAAEPQGRGAWHLHVVLIFDHPAPFIPNDVISKAWKQGFVKIKKLDDVDNVGAYLTAYLGDMELSEYLEENTKENIQSLKTIEIEDDTGQQQTKRFVKGGRLHMYPPGFHIFRWSKGIKKPVVTVTSYEQALKSVGSAKLTYEKSIVLSDPEKDFHNTLSYQYYNTTRKEQSQTGRDNNDHFKRI